MEREHLEKLTESSCNKFLSPKGGFNDTFSVFVFKDGTVVVFQEGLSL